MGSFLYNIIVYPIELLVELLFVFFFKAFDNIGIAIAAISVLISLLSLPLYNRAEAIQKKERDQRIRLQPGIDRIKAVFKGDEQYMILSTFYKQNKYHPAYTLRSSISLLIQVPFFIAAYNFLSHLTHLQGQSFIFIQDLGKPDGLFQFGSVTINILPLLMTLINIVAGAIYTKGFPMRDKLQLYGMAGLFLVLLYQSPAGLVYYWTLNNCISLIKNIFYKLKHPLRLLYWLLVLGSLSIISFIFVLKPDLPVGKRVIILIGGVCIVSVPLFLKGIVSFQSHFLVRFSNHTRSMFTLFLLSCIGLWLLCGIVIPSNLIASSPIEFSFSGVVENPLEYVRQASFVFFGICIFWPVLIYSLSTRSIRSLFAFLASLIVLSATINLFIFPGDYGVLSKILLFDEPAKLIANFYQSILPLIMTGLCLFVIAIALRKEKDKVLTAFLTILVLSSAVNGIYSMLRIQKAFSVHAANVHQNSLGFARSNDIKPEIPLSRDGRNVVILFLDRAINSYLPVIFNQFPELETQFSGFKYFPNTVTPGRVTLTGAPPILGGYEYTPDAMNARDTEKLVDKHNEALLVLPRIFSDAGYQVSIFDPPLSNYKWSNDFSIFRKYPSIHVQRLTGLYSSAYKVEHQQIEAWGPAYESRLISRRIPMFSFLKIVFPILRNLLYYEGSYFLMDENTQNINSFIDSYSVLHYLPRLTNIVTGSDSYVFIANDTTHEPVFLQAPSYEPDGNVTNTSNPLRDDSFYSELSQTHYHVNVAALRKIGVWLEYLKNEGIYDNTRIIIVADHGAVIPVPAFKNFKQYASISAAYNPLLLVKDFGVTEAFSMNDNFMTNADVPTVAIQGLPVSTLNPFTGKDLFSVVDKTLINCYNSSYNPDENRGNIFLFDVSSSFSVRDSIFKESNWTPLSSQSVKER